jgi:hypothetical protein
MATSPVTTANRPVQERILSTPGSDVAPGNGLVVDGDGVVIERLLHSR